MSIGARVEAGRLRMWEVVNQAVPDAKVGRWERAWEITAPAMDAYDAMLRAWANFPENERNVKEVRRRLQKVSEAWRFAYQLWRDEGSPQDYGTEEHRRKIQKAKARRAKAKKYSKKKD